MLYWLILASAVAGAALLEGIVLVVAVYGIYALCRKIESIYRERKGKA